MTNCGKFLRFALGEDQNNPGEKIHRLREARFCQLRFCPTCSRLKSRKIRSKFKSAIPLIQKESPDLRYIFITFTIENPDIKDLKSTIKEMVKAFQRMTKLKSFPTKNYIRVLEVSKGKIEGKCHPHLHCLLAVDNSYFDRKYDHYLTNNQWSEMWKKSCKLDYEPILDVRVVKGNPQDIAPEILKYTTKPYELLNDKEFLIQITHQMKNVQAITTGGLFKKYLRIIENDKQDLISTDSLAVNDEYQLLYTYFRKYKKYYLYKPKIEAILESPIIETIPDYVDYDLIPY